MRGTIAKRLRELAQARTIGASKERTRLEYRKLKRAYKLGKTAAGHTVAQKRERYRPAEKLYRGLRA